MPKSKKSAAKKEVKKDAPSKKVVLKKSAPKKEVTKVVKKASKKVTQNNSVVNHLLTTMVVVGKTTKSTWDEIVRHGFLIDFPDSRFILEATPFPNLRSLFSSESELFLNFGYVEIKKEFVEKFEKLRKQTIRKTGSFPIL